MTTRIAVNFPYFIPYSGYFRLFANCDVFVIFDCVPFPRRGYVHRNQLPDQSSQPEWLTLPLNKAPRDTPIKEMSFVGDIDCQLEKSFRKFPILQTPAALDHPLAQLCLKPSDDLVDFLEETLRISACLLDLPFNVVRSSSLSVDPALRGEARVLNIVEQLGGTHYINAPGGRHLYDNKRFKQHGIKLQYLDFYNGNNWSILYRFLTEQSKVIRNDILKQGLSDG